MLTLEASDQIASGIVKSGIGKGRNVQTDDSSAIFDWS